MRLPTPCPMAPCRDAVAFAKTRHLSPVTALTVLLSLAVVAWGHAQPTDSLRQTLGEWRAHTSFTVSTDASANGQFVAWATSGAVVLRYHSGEVRRLDKTNALRQGDVSRVACSPDADDLLVVGYTDGALEVLRDERSVHYVPAIAEADVTGLRGVNRIRALGGERFAIAADFGFLFFDAGEGIFLNDVRFPEPVEDIAVFAGDLYVATTQGLWVLRDFETRGNLRDPEIYESLDGVAYGGERRCYALGVDGDRLLAGFRDFVVAVEPGARTADRLFDTPGFQWVDIDYAGARVVLSAQLVANLAVSRVLVREGDGAFAEADVSCTGFVTGAAVSASGQLAYSGFGSTRDEAALTYAESPAGACRAVDLPGPSFATVFDVDARDGAVAIAAGGYTPSFNYTFNGNGAALLRDGDWTAYNRRVREVLTDTRGPGSAPLDFVTVAVADDGEAFLGSYYEGVYRMVRDEPDRDERFDEFNSTLRVSSGDPGRVRVADVAFDTRGNLWVTTRGAEEPLNVRTAAGEWYSFSLATCGGQDFPRRLALVEDGRGGLVVYVGNGGRGLLAYDTRGTIEDATDDVCRVFGVNDGLPDVAVQSLATDLDGVVWVGTDDGIATVSCPGDVTDRTACRARTPLSENVDDGVLAELFQDESVRAIAVDGGNRKWLGTSGGLFLVDDARDNPQLAAYNEDNSPLLDDEITALSYDGSTGLLWIGTGGGLMSLQTDATAAEPFAHADAVDIFPQPVRPDYDGPITIRGLARDSNVKITDTQGRLVFEVDAVGGTATWDGRDYTGRRATSGVYFVWGTATAAERQPKTVVGKIAMVR